MLSDPEKMPSWWRTCDNKRDSACNGARSQEWLIRKVCEQCRAISEEPRLGESGEQRSEFANVYIKGRVQSEIREDHLVGGCPEQ